MAVSSRQECQNVQTVVVGLPHAEAIATNVQYESVPNVCYVKVPSVMENEMHLNVPNLLNHNDLKSDKANKYALCNLDLDIEKGEAEIPESSEESIGHLKSDPSLARKSQIYLQLGGRFSQLLMNQSPDLPKVTLKADRFVGERACDMPISKSRKYKRSTSFSSRRVVLLFSFMSSMGTIILIYLTLRVRQISDR